MSQEGIITVVVNGLVFVLVAWVIGYLFRLTLICPAESLSGNADFEEFYLGLHEFATTVDYSREEAQALYVVWQRRDKVVN